MSVLDLLFIAVFLSVLAAIAAIVVAFTLRRRALARRISAVLGASVAVYLGVLVLVSVVSPRRVLSIGEDQCFDDWCASVVDVQKRPSAIGTSYTVTFRLSSRARGRPQRARDAIVYVLDEEGRRYDPLPDDSAVPFDVLLNPQQSVNTTRVFEIPKNASNPALVVSHGAGFPGWFIIGDSGSFFHRPTVVRLE